MLNKLLNLLFIFCFFTLSNCNLDETQAVLDDYDLSRVSSNVNFINEDKKLNLGIKTKSKKVSSTNITILMKYYH